MNIDFNEIINNKLQEMAENKVIEKQVEESMEKLITQAVKGAIDSYNLRNALEKQMSEQVSRIVSEIGFAGYNQYIADTFNRMVNVAMAEDIKQKIASAFDNIFINKVTKVKMSEIANKYRDFLMEELDDSEKYDYDNGFNASIEEKEDGSFTYVTVTFSLGKKRFGYSGGNDLKVRLSRIGKKPYTISSLVFEGRNLSKLEELRYLTDFESYMAALYFNKTEIEMDIDEDDIDTSLGLDI